MLSEPQQAKPSTRSILLLVVLTLAAAVGLSLACAAEVPATVTMAPVAPLKRDAGIYVIAREQRDRIVESLRSAGLRPTDEPSSGGYSLDVRLGGNRATHACGTVHNVAYILSASGRRIMVIKGRGETGQCQPNIFDDMSQTLASHAR